jgi:Na+-transporting NADH:ubiquinone oxidoreductase subunit E
MCSYLAISKTVKTASGLGIAVIFVMAMTVPIDYLLEKYLMKPGSLTWLSPGLADVDLSFLSFMVFIAVIASMTQLVEMVVEKFSPSLYNSLGIFLPLIAVNCAILGGSLFMQQREYNTLAEATVFGVGSGIGWYLAIVSIAAIKEKLHLRLMKRRSKSSLDILSLPRFQTRRYIYLLHVAEEEPAGFANAR